MGYVADIAVRLRSVSLVLLAPLIMPKLIDASS